MGQAPRFRVLGPLEVVVEGRAVELGGRKQRTLLARLLVASGEPVSVDRIADDLWSGEPPAMASASLQSYVSNLRRLLEPGRRPRQRPRHLVTTAVGYALVVDDTDRDDVAFARQLDAARAELAVGAAQVAAALAADALAGWRGPAYADVVDETWAAPVVRRLEDARLDGVELRSSALLAAGRPVDATPLLEELVEDAPYRERGWALLMAALHLGDRTADALRAFQRVRRLFAEELGLDPGTMARDVEAMILDQDDAAVRAFVAGVAASRPDTGHSVPRVVGVPLVPTPLVPSLLVPTPVAPPAVAATAAAGVLVGRDRELELVEATLRGVRATGEMASVVVGGEPGIGKTSLVQAVSRRAAADGWQVGWGRCAEDGDMPAFWPLTDAIRSLPHNGPARDELLALLRGSRDSAAGRRGAVFEALTAGLPSVVGGTPTMMVIDDVQWADPDTLAALRFLTLYLPKTPVAFVATARDRFVNPALDQLLAGLARTSGVRLRLGPLAPADIAQLAARHGAAELDAELVEAVSRRSAGNPFFASELLRLPSEQLRAATLPDAVRDVIRHRLATHPDEVVALVTAAAVLGERIDLDLLCGTSALTVDRACDLLDSAVATGMLRDGDDGSFAFSHALVREAVASLVTVTQRQRIQLRAANASAALPGRRRGERAHLLAAAGSRAAPADVVEAARDAAREATHAGGYDEAVRWRRLVVERLDATSDQTSDQQSEPATRAAAHRELGAALLRAGSSHDGHEEIVIALDLAAAARDPAAAAEAAAALAAGSGAWPWNAYQEQPHRIVRALARAANLVADRPAAEQAQVLVHLALASYYLDETPEQVRAGRTAAELATRAIDLVDSAGDPPTAAAALANACFALWKPGPDSLIDGVVRRLFAMLDQRPDPVLELIGHHFHLVTALVRGSSSAFAALDAAEDLIERARLPLFTTVGFGWAKVSVLAAAGDVDGALAQLDLATSQQVRSGLVDVEACRLLSLVNVAFHAGRLELLAGELPGGLGDDHFGAEYRALAAVVDSDDRDLARKILAEHPAEQWPRDWTWRGLMMLRAEVAELAGAVEEAEPLRRLLAPHRGLVANFGTVQQCLGPVDLALGRMALLCGEADAAAASLRAAAGVATRVGAPVWLARTRFYLARALRSGASRASGGGDDDDPDALVERAETAARQLNVRLPVGYRRSP